MEEVNQRCQLLEYKFGLGDVAPFRSSSSKFLGPKHSAIFPAIHLSPGQ